MRRKKKDDGRIDHHNTDQVMAASMTMVRFAWQTECRLRGFPEDSPLDIQSLVTQVANVAKQVFDVDLDSLKVADLLDEKIISQAGLEVDNNLIRLSNLPNKEIITRLYKTVGFNGSAAGSREGALKGIEIMERLKREHNRVSDLFN